jgi:ferredoxin-NADP reductase
MTDAIYSPLIDAVWQTGSVTRIEPRTPRITSFYITPERPFTFVAGQHADVRLTAEDGYIALRSYSIASAPAEAQDGVELAIERLESGEVSPFFHDAVGVGDQIELRAPLGGHFVWRPEDGGPLLLIGGGSGLVPLIAMIRHRRAERSPVPCALLLSARNWNEVLFREELIALSGSGDGFSLTLALTRDSPRRADDFGRRVDAAMIAHVVGKLPAAPKLAYLCGANAFVNVAADGAVAAGVPAGVIRTERYGGWGEFTPIEDSLNGEICFHTRIGRTRLRLSQGLGRDHCLQTWAERRKMAGSTLNIIAI